LSETYDLFKRGLGYDADRLARTYAEWDRSEVSSFLVQITADIFRKTDPETGKQLVEMIVDAARQKGTGKWTTEETINLQVPAPAIDQAVVMRDLSRLREERRRLSEVLPGPSPRFDGDPEAMARALRDGFEVAMLLAYTQGFALLREASRQYGYGLSCETVARIWRGGCIIRATMLEDIAQAFRAQPDLELLMASPAIARTLGAKHGALREVVRIAARCGIPAPAFMASLGYYDGFRTANLPTNLTQAQRDYFGAHTYERLDRPGVFHTQWQ
jgi:6-phosphogluconate dehydrogenase